MNFNINQLFRLASRLRLMRRPNQPLPSDPKARAEEVARRQTMRRAGQSARMLVRLLRMFR